MNYQNFKNDKAKFPLSTDSMDFLQNQVLELGSVISASAGCENVIISMPTSTTDGLCIYSGEVMPLKYGTGATSRYINVVEETESVTAKGETYYDARISNYAVYATSGIAANNFVIYAEACTLPKGSIILWNASSTDLLPSDIPSGFVPACLIKIVDQSVSRSQIAWSNSTIIGGAAITVNAEEFDDTTKAKLGYNGYVIVTEANGLTIPNLISSVPDGCVYLMKVI